MTVIISPRQAGRVTASRACAFAYDKLRGQIHRDGKPAFAHTNRVAMKVAHNALLMVVAYLHDLIEDTDVTEADIREKFGEIISTAVAAITREQGESWKHYIQKVACNRLAIQVKLADIEDNLSRMDVKMATGSRNGDMYREAYVYLKDRLAQSN